MYLQNNNLLKMKILKIQNQSKMHKVNLWILKMLTLKIRRTLKVSLLLKEIQINLQNRKQINKILEDLDSNLAKKKMEEMSNHLRQKID